MASAGGSACHSDPNFAVICCFLEKYGEILGLPVISFVDLQEYLEDTKTVSRPLVDLHVRLLKRIGKTNVNHERFERSITKFCFYFSDHDGWEMERFGYRHAQLSTKLRVLKNLLECQFDYNVKFKEKINEFQPEELRFLPAGRDKDGMTYWYLLDKDLNVHIYREEPDDETAETWKLVCSDRDQLAALLDRLRKNTQRNFGEEDKDDKDDKSSIFTDESKTTSKEGSPDRDTNSVAFALDTVKEEMDDVKHEPPDPASVVSAPQVQPSITLTQTDKHEAANTASGSLIMKVKLEHVAEEQRPPEDAADPSNSAELQIENKASKPKKKAGKRKEKSPTGSDKGSEPSPNTANVRNSRESSCEVIVEPSEGAAKSDPSQTTELDRSEAGQSDSSSVVAPSTESPPAVSSQSGETDEGSASKDSSVGESSGGVKDTSVGESSGGVKDSSVGESSSGVKDSSVDKSSGGVKDSSVGESSSGVKDSSVDKSSSGVKDSSVGKSSSGVKDSSVGKSSSGVKDSSVSESSGGVKDSSVGESSSGVKDSSVDKSSSGVKDSSVGESSSGVKDSSVDKSSSGVKDSSVGESSSGVKDSSVGESSSGVKDTSVGESSSGVKDTSVSESSGSVKDSSVSESSGSVKDTSVSESSGSVKDSSVSESSGSVKDSRAGESSSGVKDSRAGESSSGVKDSRAGESSSGVKDSRAGESSSGAKRREDPLLGQRTDDESPEKKRRESDPESSVSNSTASASGSFHLTPGCEGVDKPESDRKTEGEGEQVCQSAEECLTKSDLKTDDGESKTREVPAPQSKERMHEDQGPKGHHDEPQKEPDGKVSPVTSDKDKGDNANFDSEPTETVLENKTLPKESSDKSKITGASPEEVQVSGETDENELSNQGDKDDSMTCKEGGESDVPRTECSGGSSEGTEPADSMAWKEALESSKDDSSTSGKQKEASEMKTEDPSPPPAASEKSDVDSSGQSVQMSEKEGQTSFVEEKACKKESVAQISDCKSPTVKVDEKRASVSIKEDSAESKDSAESSSTTSCASAVSENEGKGAVPLDVKSEVKALPLTADDVKTKGRDQESEADELVASNERNENETSAKHGGMSETAPKEKMSGNDVDKSDEFKQNRDSESAEENVTVDHNESKETQPLNKNEAPSEKDTDSLKKAKIGEEEARVTESSCEMKTVGSRTESKGSEGNDKAADASGGDQGTSSVSLPGSPDEEEEATSSEVTASEKLQEPKPEKGEVEHVRHDQDTKSENVKSAEESIDADESTLDHKLESEHSVSSPSQCSAEVKSLSHKLSSGGENNVKNNTALQNSVTKESSSAVDSKLAVTEDLSEETADSSKNEEKVDSKVVEIRVVRLEGSALSPGDKATAQSLASENSSKDSRIGESTANSDQKENASGKTIDSNDSTEIITSVHDDKESSKCDATEIEGNVEKMEDKEAEPSRPRSLRKRRGRQAMKAKDTADADSVQKLNENTIKETRTSGKRKAENQSKCTNQQEAESEAKCADKPQAQDAIKSADKQESEKLVNGHTDLGEEQEKDEAETADAKTTTKPMRGASRRGRGGSRGRGRGGRRGSRVAKRTAAEVDSEEISTAPAEKRARRGGLKRRGAASRSLAKSLAQGKDDESSSDSNTPLINCKGQSKPSATKGGSPRKTPASKKAADMEKDKDSSSSDDLPLSKAAKKKKIVGEDSSDFEPEEPIAPSKKSLVGKTPKPAAKTKKDERESMEKENEPVSVMSAYSTRRSLRIQTMKKKEPDPDFDILSEVGQSGDLSSEVELPSEEDSEDDDFKPHQGRNRRRQAALKKKEEEKVPMDDTPCLVCNNCTHPDMMLLCDSCDKGYHMACLRPPLMAIPEGDWFCPPCEHGKLIEKLTEYLQELDTNSRKKDRLVRRKERLAFVGISLDNILKEEKIPDVCPRKIVVDEKSEDEEENAEEEQEEETEEEEREDDYIRPRRRKSKGAYSTQRRPSHRTGHSRKRHDREHSDDDDRADLPEEVYAKRTCRTRSTVSYQFKEYDDLIKSAIQEDLNDPKPPRPRPPGRSRGKDLSSLPGMYSDEAEEEMDTESTDQEGSKGMGKDMSNILGNKSDPEEEAKEKKKNAKGKSRGKDMSNILGMDSDEEKELRRRQKEEALAAAAASEGRPPPVVKRKNRRRLTMLDSDDNQDEDDDSEEFQLSESDEDSEASVEASQDEDDDLTEEDSGNWRPQRTWYNKAASRQTMRRGTCRSRSSRFDRFVVDDDYDSDELASKRRSTRNSTKRRIRYRDWESDSEESEMETEDSDVSLSELSSDDPEYRRRNDRKKARRKYTSETETSGSEFMVRINRAKKRRVARSDSDEDSGSSQRQRSSKGRKASKSSKVSSKTKGRNRNVNCSEDDSATEVEDEVPKKKNVLRDSSTEEEAEELKEAEDEYGEDEDTEVEGDSQQTEPVIHKTPVAGPQNEVKQTVTEKEEAAPAVEQESKQVSEAALATEKISEFEPEQPKAAAKLKKPRGKGKGKRAVSQGEDLSEEDKPERVECGTDMQDDAPVSTIEPVSSAVSGSPAQQGPPPNFLNVSTDPSSVADSSSLKQGQNMPPFSAPVSTHPHPGEPPMQHPHGAPFRPRMEGGFPSQYERYPHPGSMGPQGQEGMRYPAPFPHGPYPMPGDGFRGHQPDTMQQPTSDKFFRPQAMVPYGLTDGLRAHGQPGQGHREGFRPPFSQIERLRYPYRPTGPDGFQPQGPMRGFQPSGPHQEGSQPLGPPQDNTRHPGPVQAFQPSGQGQAVFPPRSQNQDNFQPQVSAHQSYRPGQEGFPAAGLRQGHRLPASTLEAAQISNKERLQAGPGQERVQQAGSSQDRPHQAGPSQKQLQQAGQGQERLHQGGQGQERLQQAGPGPERLQQAGPGQEQLQIGPGQERIQAGQGQERCQLSGPGQDSVQRSTGKEAVHPPLAEHFHIHGQKGLRPPHPGMEGFRPPYPGQESFRPGQEGFGSPGSGQSFRFPYHADFRYHSPLRPQSSRLEGFRPPASGPATFPQPGQAQEAFRPPPQSPGVRPPAASQGFRPSGQEAFRVTGPGPEDLRSTGAQPGFKPPVSNQDTFRAPGPDSDRFRPPGPDSDRFRAPGPDSDRFRAPGPDSDRFRPPGPDSDRFRAPGPDSDRFRPPGPDSDRFRLPGSNSDRFRAPGPDSDRFRAPGPDSDRLRAPGPDSERFRSPDPDNDRFRPPGPGSDRFRAPGPESDRFRPHVPVSGFSGKSPGHDQQQSGLEGFKHVNPGQRFPSPEGHGPTSSQESVQHMKVSDSVKPSGQESVPSSSRSQERPQAQGPPQGFPFQHPQYEAFQMPGHGFWPPTTGFRPAGSHQRFWPPPGHHHMRPSGPVPEGFHLMGHPRGIHPSEHGQGAFPPGFRSAGMGEGYRPAFMSPGQIEGYRPQEPMGIGQSQQSHPTNLPFNATGMSAMQSVSGQSNPAQSHSSRNDVSQTQIRASEELKTDGSQRGGKMCAMTGSLESEDQENLQPQDLSVQSNRGGSQNCVEQDKSVRQSEESRPLESHAREEASKPVDLSQQSKGPSLQMSSGDLAEGCKPSRGTDGSKPLEGMQTVIPPLQGSEVKPQTPPEIKKGHEHQILPKQIEENQLEGRSENSEESKPQEQSESLPSESLPQPSKETQPENQAKDGEEIKSKGHSEGSEISTQQVSTELNEGTEIKETPKSDVSVPWRQEMSEGLTQDNEESRSQVPAEWPDESGSEDPPGQAKESKKCPVQDKQGEGPERSKPEKSSSNVEESEEPKPGECSSQVKEHEQSKPEGSSGQVEGPDDSKPAGSSDSMDGSKESHVQDNLRPTEESKSRGPGESEESSLQDVSGQSEAAITTNVCSGQNEEAKDTSTEDKDIKHQDPSKQMESLKSQESVKQEREGTSQVTPSHSEGIKQAENDGVQKPASSEHAVKPQGQTEDPRSEALPAQTEEITSKVPASQNEELGSKDVSENNGQKQDSVEQSEGSKPQGSTGEIEEQPQPSSGQNESNTQEEETAKAHGPLRQDGFTPQFPSRPGEECQTQDSSRTEACRPQGPRMQIERFRPPYSGGQGEDLRSPGLSGERFRPPFPPGEGSRPPVPPVEQFILKDPSGEGFRPQGPSGEGFRPPGPSGEGFRPPNPSGEGFRPQSSSSEGFKSVGPSEEGFRSPDSSGPVEESQQSGPLPGGEGFKGQMTPSHADGFKHPGATGGFHPPMSGQGEGFRMPMGPEGFRPHGPEGFHPQGHEGFQPRGFYPPFPGHPYYPPEAGQTFHGGPPPPGFGMYPPHQFSPDQRMFGPGGPGPYHPMMPPVSQVPGVLPAGRGGFMIDNLLRSKSGELPPPHVAPAVSTGSPQMTPPHSTPPHGTPPHATPPYATPPHGTPPHSTPPHVTPPHSTPPLQSQIQQLQPLQKKTSPSMEAGERMCKSPQTASQGDDGDDGDVSQIMSYVMNDEFFKEQTSS